MSISMDEALGIHQYALGVRAERARVISGNLANSDTPGYLAKDIDFKTILRGIEKTLSSTGKVEPQNLDLSSSTKYRNPFQASMDGNTVELSVEQAAFSSNAMDFQRGVTFLKMKIAGLRQAIEGK